MIAERNIFGRMDGWKDSFADSEDPNYKVSFGRDVANLFGSEINIIKSRGTQPNSTLDTTSGIGKLISGSVDAAADMTFDPVRIVTSVPAAVAGGKYLEVVAGAEGLS